MQPSFFSIDSIASASCAAAGSARNEPMSSSVAIDIVFMGLSVGDDWRPLPAFSLNDTTEVVG